MRTAKKKVTSSKKSSGKKVARGAKAKKAPAKAKSATKKSAKKSALKDNLLVVSKTKESLKNYDINVASDALEGLNEQIHWLINQAVRRAQANNRKTVRSHDFVVV